MIKFLYNLNTLVFGCNVLFFIFLMVVVYTKLTPELFYKMKKNKKANLSETFVNVLRMLLIFICPLVNMFITYIFIIDFESIVNKAIENLEDKYSDN